MWWLVSTYLIYSLYMYLWCVPTRLARWGGASEHDVVFPLDSRPEAAWLGFRSGSSAPSLRCACAPALPHLSSSFSFFRIPLTRASSGLVFHLTCWANGAKVDPGSETADDRWSQRESFKTQQPFFTFSLGAWLSESPVFGGSPIVARLLKVKIDLFCFFSKHNIHLFGVLLHHPVEQDIRRLVVRHVIQVPREYRRHVLLCCLRKQRVHPALSISLLSSSLWSRRSNSGLLPHRATRPSGRDFRSSLFPDLVSRMGRWCRSLRSFSVLLPWAGVDMCLVFPITRSASRCLRDLV